MKRKRIVIVHNWIEVGINIQSRQLAYELSKEYDVWFLSASRTGSPEFKVNDHLTVLEWPDKRPTKFRDLWFCWNFFKKISPDVVMAHFTGIRLSMLGAWLAGVKHRVAWYHILSEQLKGIKKGKWSERLMIEKFRAGYLFANYVVAFHEFGKQDANRFLRKPLENIFIVPNGLSLNPLALKKIATVSDAPVFLFLGRLDVSKGGDMIIKCFAKISEKYNDVKLLIVGDGDRKMEWEGLVKSLHLEKNVSMPGRTTSYNLIFDYLEKAYALLVPSRIDNFPTVIIEAFSAGVPVIASDSGGIPDMVKDGVDGFICETYNEKAWVDKIDFLINNAGLRNEMSMQARKSYEERFTLEKHFNNVMALLSQIGISVDSKQDDIYRP